MVVVVLVGAQRNGWELENLLTSLISATNQLCDFEHLKSLSISSTVRQEQQTFLGFRKNNCRVVMGINEVDGVKVFLKI